MQTDTADAAELRRRLDTGWRDLRNGLADTFLPHLTLVRFPHDARVERLDRISKRRHSVSTGCGSWRAAWVSTEPPAPRSGIVPRWSAVTGPGFPHDVACCGSGPCNWKPTCCSRPSRVLRSAFRTICREIMFEGKGVGPCLHRPVFAQGLAARHRDKPRDLAQTNDFDKPVGMQLYGSDPAIMADGTLGTRPRSQRHRHQHGCPVDKVTKKDGGSRLLYPRHRRTGLSKPPGRRSPRVREPVPVTCKMRLGWFANQPVARVPAPRLVRAGAVMITIHGRTTEQKFTGVVDRAGIAEVVRAVKRRRPTSAVIGNGDVTHPTHVLQMIQETGCDG